MVGRWISFWVGLFSGAMLVLGRVTLQLLDDSNSQTFNKKSYKLPFRWIDWFLLLKMVFPWTVPQGFLYDDFRHQKKPFGNNNNLRANNYHDLFGMSNLVREWVYVKTWPESQRLVIFFTWNKTWASGRSDLFPAEGIRGPENGRF